MNTEYSGLSISEALTKFKNGTLGYATKCNGCTACCRIYSDIKGVKIVDGTTTCSKVKNKGCKIWSRRPAACREYTCYVFYMTGVVNHSLLENNGKVFTFSVENKRDIAITIIFYFLGKKFGEVLGGQNLDRLGYSADDLAGFIIGLGGKITYDTDYFSHFLKMADQYGDSGISDFSELANSLRSRNSRLAPELDSTIEGMVKAVISD